MPMDLLCRLQSENRRMKEQNADLLAALQIVKEDRQKWWGKAVARGAELFLRESVTPCTFPDCMSARAVRAAGEEYQRGVVEGLRLAVEAAEDIPTSVSVHATAHDASVATRCKEAIVMAVGAVREASTKDGVCEWTKAEIDHHGNEFWKPSCDKAPTFYFCGPFGFYQFRFCPYCGRTVKEAK